MKKIVISCMILLIGICSTSQAASAPLQIGPRVGIGGSHLMLKLDKNENVKYETDLGFTWHVGVVGRVDFTYVYIQPELLFTSSGATYHSANNKYALHYRKLNMPIMVGIKLKELIRLQVGPTLSILLSAKEGEDDVSVNYNGFTAGWQAGIGVDLGPFMIDGSYEGNLSKFGKKLEQINVPVDHREGLFKLSVGLDLLSLIRTDSN
jgi:hypothetical protein